MFRRFIPFVIFSFPLGVYIRTLSPTVNFGDTGELITAAETLGIPHPPGFSLWVMLAHLFTYIPHGSIAWRVNLSSAVFSAGIALALFYLLKSILSRIFDDERVVMVVSASTALVAVFSHVVWSQAIIAEVYALHGLLTLFITFFLVRFSYSKGRRYLFAAVFILGLSMTNHYLSLVFFPPIILWLLMYERALLRSPRHLLFVFCFFALGLLPFIFLPLRSVANPIIDWGNPETFASFISVVTREQFAHIDQARLAGISVPLSTLAADSPITRAWDTVHLVGFSLTSSYSFIGLLIGIGGVFFLWWHQRRMFWLVILLWGAAGPGLAFAIGDRVQHGQNFVAYLAGILLFTPFIAAGIGWLLEWALQRRPSLSRAVPVLFLLPLLFVLNNFQSNDQSLNTVAYDHAYNVLAGLEEGALLFAEENEWLFPLLYVHAIEGVRPDVTVYDRNGNLFDDIYREAKQDYRSEPYYEQKRRALELNLIQSTGRPGYYAVDKAFENYGYDDVSPAGIVYRHGKEAVPVDFVEEYVSILDLDPFTFDDNGSTAYIVAYYHMQYGESLRREGDREGALQAYDQAYSWGSGDTRILNNLGILYATLGEKGRAEESFRDSLSLDSRRNHVAHNNLGTLLEERGEFVEAEQSYLRALESHPQYIPALLNLAALYEQKGELDRAMAGYQAVLQLNPADGSVENRLRTLQERIENGGSSSTFEEALLLAKEGKCDEAIIVFEKLHETMPEDARVLNNLGVCYATLGDLDQAEQAWEEALIVDPENVSAQTNLQLLQR